MCIITKRQIVDNFATNIEIERAKLGLSQSQMAKELDMSLTAYKNMVNGISVNIPIFVAYLAYKLTNKHFFELCGYITPEINLLTSFSKLSKYRQEAVLSMISLEAQLSTDCGDNSLQSEENLVPLYTLTGNMTDGMIYDSTNIQPLNVEEYKKIYGDIIDCGIKITSNHLHPVYFIGDILLIHFETPRDGDTGIFIHKDTGRLYIRKVRQTSPIQLVPVCDIGQTIYIDDKDPADMKKWIKLGYVIAKMR